MPDDRESPRARVADLLQKAGDRLRGVFTEGPNAALLNELRDVEPARDPLGLRARALGVLSIDSDEMVIVLDGAARDPARADSDESRKSLLVRVAPGAIAISGGILPRAALDGVARDVAEGAGVRDGFLRWAVLRASPERVHEWTFAARTADRIVVARDRAMLIDSAARDDLAGARDRLASARVAVLASRRYAMLVGESPAKVVVGKGRNGDVVAVALDFSP